VPAREATRAAYKSRVFELRMMINYSIFDVLVKVALWNFE